MTDITELAQRNELLIANGQQTADLLRHLADNEIDSDYFAVVSECESYGKETDAELSITEFALRAAGYVDALVEALEKAQQRIAELENNEIQEEGNQFLVVRHPGKVPVIKHPVGELEDYLRQIFKANPLATIDIVTHRYYGVGGQFVKDADEYLHEMSVKVEAE
ncbi:TPA: hypothetical protein ACW0GZ_005364 [Klebsiella pneumoniae]